MPFVASSRAFRSFLAPWRSRALADVVHPNLIALYELMGDDRGWFLTMELLEGAGFMDYVRPAGLRLDRLRGTLRQLADGLVALHAAGKLHRDLKPSNVMATPGDRTVILDFGIATDVGAPDINRKTVATSVFGTPAYMSPEQVSGEAVEASDWYALGIMLYEALTGELPFQGNYLAVLAAKLQGPPPPPDTVTPGLPADLTGLCVDLLSVDPAARATGDDLLRRLGAPRAVSGVTLRAARPPVIGREVQLSGLREALQASRAGRRTVATGPWAVRLRKRARCSMDFWRRPERTARSSSPAAAMFARPCRSRVGKR